MVATGKHYSLCYIRFIILNMYYIIHFLISLESNLRYMRL